MESVQVDITENLEDQVDRLNAILADLMLNYDSEAPTLETENNEEDVDMKQYNLISESVGGNDSYVDFDMSTILDTEDNCYEESISMRCEDFRSHEMRKNKDIENVISNYESMADMQECMYNAQVEIKQELEIEVDRLKQEVDFLRGSELKHELQNERIRLQEAQEATDNSSKTKLDLIRSALSEVTTRTNITNIDAIEKVMWSKTATPEKLKIHIDTIKNKAINQRGEEVISNAKAQAKKFCTTLNNLQKTFDTKSGSARKRRPKTQLKTKFWKPPTTPSARPAQTPRSKDLSFDKLQSPRQGMTEELLNTQLLKLQSEKAIQESQRMAKNLDRSIGKMWAIEVKESTKPPRIPRSPRQSRLPVSNTDENRNLKMQLRITKKTLEAEKQQLLSFAKELATKERQLLLASEHKDSRKKVSYIINMMEREKQRILAEKAELKQEREAINEAKEKLAQDNSLISQAKSMINQKIKKIIAVDGQVSASLEQMQFQKIDLAKELEPIN